VQEKIKHLDYDYLKESLSEIQNKNIQNILYIDSEMNMVLTTTENQKKKSKYQ